MIPRLGDGNLLEFLVHYSCVSSSLENDSPSRGRKLGLQLEDIIPIMPSLENDSPSRGRKLYPILSLIELVLLV